MNEARTLPQAIRELLLAMPDTEEIRTHGTPTFKAAGKTFAYFTLNHHGDGRAALWLAAPKDAQANFVALDPEAYFVPPYVGPRGWLGIDLGSLTDWTEVTARAREAWVNVVPGRLVDQLPDDLGIEPPAVGMTAEEINPLLGPRPRAVLAELGKRCRRLPECAPAGDAEGAAWKAGKKVFVRVHLADERLKLQFWTGIEQQAFLTADPRFSLPMYRAGAGWIDLDVEDQIIWEEVDSLLETSYRHFALKRMLRALDGKSGA